MAVTTRSLRRPYSATPRFRPRPYLAIHHLIFRPSPYKLPSSPTLHRITT